jgi:hypothetical protein
MVWPDKATKNVPSFIIINCWHLVAPSNTGFALILLHANNYVLYCPRAKLQFAYIVLSSIWMPPSAEFCFSYIVYFLPLTEANIQLGQNTILLFLLWKNMTFFVSYLLIFWINLQLPHPVEQLQFTLNGPENMPLLIRKKLFPKKYEPMFWFCLANFHIKVHSPINLPIKNAYDSILPTETATLCLDHSFLLSPFQGDKSSTNRRFFATTCDKSNRLYWHNTKRLQIICWNIKLYDPTFLA